MEETKEHESREEEKTRKEAHALNNFAGEQNTKACPRQRLSVQALVNGPTVVIDRAWWGHRNMWLISEVWFPVSAERSLSQETRLVEACIRCVFK